MYCQDYPRFPKINSNELYRKGHLERERDDLYPGKEKNQLQVASQVRTHSCCTLRDQLLLPKPVVDISSKVHVISCC